MGLVSCKLSFLMHSLCHSVKNSNFRHEGYNVNNPGVFSRSWFAWANTVFGDYVLHLDQEYPHLLQGPPTDPIDSGSLVVQFELSKLIVVVLCFVLVQIYE